MSEQQMDPMSAYAAGLGPMPVIYSDSRSFEQRVEDDEAQAFYSARERDPQLDELIAEVFGVLDRRGYQLQDERRARLRLVELLAAYEGHEGGGRIPCPRP